tara:strand:- start:211 stop:561 length:351 start_codon:yes stop_codon:yes gene_type:complete
MDSMTGPTSGGSVSVLPSSHKFTSSGEWFSPASVNAWAITSGTSIFCGIGFSLDWVFYFDFKDNFGASYQRQDICAEVWWQFAFGKLFSIAYSLVAFVENDGKHSATPAVFGAPVL